MTLEPLPPTESQELVLPGTGEIVDLAKPAEVAYALDQVRDTKRRLDELRAMLERLLADEARVRGTKTLYVGDWKAVVSGGEKKDYDAEELRDLLELAGCPADRIDELITVTVTYKVDQRVAKQLAAANDEYAEALLLTERKEEAPWRVSVTRERGVR